MKKINNLVEQYEVLLLEGENTVTTAIDICKELIESGFLPEELTDESEVADILLIDLKYEFATEEVLEALVTEITVVAKADRLISTYNAEVEEIIEEYNALEEEANRLINALNSLQETISSTNTEEIEVDMDTAYIVSVINVDIETGNKYTTVLDSIFGSLEDVRGFVDNIGLERAVQNLMYGTGKDTGSIGMLVVEEATEMLDELGVDGMLIADQIPVDATAVMALVDTDKERTTIKSAELYVVFEANDYR